MCAGALCARVAGRRLGTCSSRERWKTASSATSFTMRLTPPDEPAERKIEEVGSPQVNGDVEHLRIEGVRKLRTLRVPRLWCAGGPDGARRFHEEVCKTVDTVLHLHAQGWRVR